MARGIGSAGKIRVATASVVVGRSAPPTPVSARAAINGPVESASSADSEPIPNGASPATSIFLRP